MGGKIKKKNLIFYFLKLPQKSRPPAPFSIIKHSAHQLFVAVFSAFFAIAGFISVISCKLTAIFCDFPCRFHLSHQNLRRFLSPTLLDLNDIRWIHERILWWSHPFWWSACSHRRVPDQDECASSKKKGKSFRRKMEFPEKNQFFNIFLKNGISRKNPEKNM